METQKDRNVRDAVNLASEQPAWSRNLFQMLYN